jgi:hypothetical protein
MELTKPRWISWAVSVDGEEKKFAVFCFLGRSCAGRAFKGSVEEARGLLDSGCESWLRGD